MSYRCLACSVTVADDERVLAVVHTLADAAHVLAWSPDPKELLCARTSGATRSSLETASL